MSSDEHHVVSYAKANFLAVISHEMRTPLTAIIGYTELLVDEVVGPLNAIQRDHLERVRANGEHLLLLIEDMLRFAGQGPDSDHVELESFDIAVPVQRAVEFARPRAELKKLVLRVEPCDEPVILRSDSAIIRKILVNLLSNAIKFTDRGDVTIEVRATAERATVAVTDTGIGIPPEHLEHVFDIFWQLDQEETRRAAGAGIGLSVARQLARILGGDITVGSVRGRGSTFALTIPLKS